MITENPLLGVFSGSTGTCLALVGRFGNAYGPCIRTDFRQIANALAYNASMPSFVQHVPQLPFSAIRYCSTVGLLIKPLPATNLFGIFSKLYRPSLRIHALNRPHGVEHRLFQLFFVEGFRSV